MGIAGFALLAATCVSGIYPDLVMYDDEGECGTGAVVPWADRLWVVTYAPHAPLGSSNRLYEITPDFRQVIRPESVGGTPANRMIHRESNRLLIGHHVIDADGRVSTVPIAKMPGRLTGAARHLVDPANKVYVGTMETGLYELDMRTLEPRTLIRERTASYCRFENKLDTLPNGWTDAPLTAVPGYHGKGLATGFGRVFIANNGEDSPAARQDPFVPSGVLAWWNEPGRDWTTIRRCQFTEVTTRDGIYGNEHPETNPVWALGWDARSVILAVNEKNDWRYYRLPKGSHSYDGAHGWNTEWPRIRDVGRKDLLATMHGTFWDFPAAVSQANMAGIRPVSTYLKVIGDFCEWQGKAVFGCDDLAKSEFLGKRRAKGERKRARRSQSNLWFVEKDALGSFGPRVGHGAVWSGDAVKRGSVSDPYLFAGYDRKWLWITAGEYEAELDERGDGAWRKWKTFAAGGHDLTDAPRAEWIRFVARADAAKATVSLHYSSAPRTAGPKPFETPAPAGAEEAFSDEATIPDGVIAEDAASLIYTDDCGARWRLPRARAGVKATNGRFCREVCTERDLLNVGGIFYEMPADNAGGVAVMKPVASHPAVIADYASWKGLVIVRRCDRPGLFAGAVDDLWAYGAPQGFGGPWRNSVVRAGVLSEPFLLNGFDYGKLTLEADRPVAITMEAEIDGQGTWQRLRTFRLGACERLVEKLPAAFSAYWVRFVCDRDAVLTAQFGEVPDADARCVNLLNDGLFRPAAGIPAGWSQGGPSGDAKMSAASGVAHDGAPAVKIEVPADSPLSWYMLSHPVTGLRAKTPYTISAWVKTEGCEPEAMAYLSLCTLRANGRRIAANDSAVKVCGNSKWRRIVHTVPALQDGTMSAKFVCCLYGRRGTAYFAGLQVEEGARATDWTPSAADAAARVADAAKATSSAAWLRRNGLEGIPAGTPRIAVLDLGFGSGSNAFGCVTDPETFERTLAPLGRVCRLKGNEAAQPGVLCRRTIDLLVVPTGSAWPAAAAGALVDYLREGGSLLCCGGYAFDTPVYFRDGRWQTKVALPSPSDFPIEMKLPPVARWRTSAPEGASVAVAAADGGIRVSSRLFRLWATAMSGLDASGLRGSSAISFRARATGGATKATLELDETDGSRWQVHFPVGAEWRDYAFSSADFVCWTDSKAVGRGGEGDHVDFEKVRTMAFGCSPNEAVHESAMSVTFKDFRRGVDPCLAERLVKPPQINTRTAHIRDAIHPNPTQVNAFDPSFELRHVAKVATAPQLADILPEVAVTGGYRGLAAIAQLGVGGHGYDANRCAWRPILEASDANGEDRGPAAAFVWHHTGTFAGSAWAIFGVDDADLFAAGSPIGEKLLPAVAARLLRRLALNETTTSYACYRVGETARLRTRVGNFGSRAARGLVRFALKDENGRLLTTVERPFAAQPNANHEVESEWPVGKDAPDYVAFTAELVLEDGTVYDREPGAFVVWNEDVIAKGPKLSKQGSLLAIDGRPAFYMGAQTYWGQTRPTVARSPMSFHRDFAQMRAAGLRWTRLFLPWTSESDKRISDACVQLAQKHGLVIYHTQQACSCMVQGEELKRQNDHFREIGARYRDVPGFAVDIRNEPTMNLPPSWESAKRMRTWLATDRAATREARPGALVSVGWSQGWAGGKGSKDPAWCSLDLDFTDRHYYGPSERMYRDLKDVDLRVLGKPLILAECGAKCHPTFVKEDPWRMGDTDEQYDVRFRSLVTHAFALGASALLSWHWRDPMEGIFPCGLVHATGVKRPTAALFAHMARTFGRLRLKENPPDVVIRLAEAPRMEDKGRAAFLERAYAVDAALLHWGANWSKVTESALGGCRAKLVLDPSALPTDDARTLRQAVGDRLKAAGCAFTRRPEDPEALETYRVPGEGANGWVFFNGGTEPLAVERFGRRLELGGGHAAYLQRDEGGTVEVAETF